MDTKNKTKRLGWGEQIEWTKEIQKKFKGHSLVPKMSSQEAFHFGIEVGIQSMVARLHSEGKLKRVKLKWVDYEKSYRGHRGHFVEVPEKE